MSLNTSATNVLPLDPRGFPGFLFGGLDHTVQVIPFRHPELLSVYQLCRIDTSMGWASDLESSAD